MPVWSCSWDRGDSCSTHGWRVPHLPEAGGFYTSLQQMPWTDCVQPISSTSATCTLTTSGRVCQCCSICPSMMDTSCCPYLGVNIMLSLLSLQITFCMQFVFFQQVFQPQTIVHLYVYTDGQELHEGNKMFTCDVSTPVLCEQVCKLCVELQEEGKFQNTVVICCHSVYCIAWYITVNIQQGKKTAGVNPANSVTADKNWGYLDNRRPSVNSACQQDCVHR